jgi:hypothetical protein
MARLRQVNVSLGLMLENVSPIACALPGMPHHKAPDKRPERRIAMTRGRRAAASPSPAGICSSASARRGASGGEPAGDPRSRDARTGTSRRSSSRTSAPTRTSPWRARWSRMTSRSLTPWRWRALILDPDRIGVQAPPNLNPGARELLLDAGPQRLRRHLAGDARLHQPAAPVAAPRRAGRGLRAAWASRCARACPSTRAYLGRPRLPGPGAARALRRRRRRLARCATLATWPAPVSRSASTDEQRRPMSATTKNRVARLPNGIGSRVQVRASSKRLPRRRRALV